MARGGSMVLMGALALAGCGGGGSEANPLPPAFDRDVFGALSALPVTTDLPRGGSARYEGGFRADIRQADVTPTGWIAGGVTLDLDFADHGARLPLSGELHDIEGEFLSEPVAIAALPLVPGGGLLEIARSGGAGRGVMTAGFGAGLPLAGQARRLDIALDSPLRGPRGRALAGPVSGTILTAPFTDQPHILTGQFHATTE